MKETDRRGDQALPVVIPGSLTVCNGLCVHVRTYSRQWHVVCNTCMRLENAVGLVE